jgi:xylulokinase
MNTWFAAIDCGTTTIKTGLCTERGDITGLVRGKTPCTYFDDGRIEQDPGQMARQTLRCIGKSVERSGISPGRVEAISLSTQRATVLCLDRKREPVGRAISWQDMRGAGQIAQFRKKMRDSAYSAITGLPANPVFTIGKLLWIRRKAPDLYRSTAAFALVHDFLLSVMGCRDVVCDWSNASLTGLLDVRDFSWSDEIVGIAGLDMEKLPHLVPSGRIVGKLSRKAASVCGLREGTPLVSGGGDQQCAGLGAGCIAPGILEITLGTAAVSLCYADRPAMDPSGRITTCAHAVPGAWNLEGLQNSAGASLTWLREILGWKGRLPKSMLNAADQVPLGARGVMYFPWLAGSASPHWIPNATGVFTGLTHRADQAALLRAVMEGVSLETAQILGVFEELGIPVEEIRLTGGHTTIDMWSRMQADIFGKRLVALDQPEASLLGAAMLAAFGVGAFTSLQESAGAMVKPKAIFEPDEERSRAYAALLSKYRAAQKSLVKAGIFSACRREA